MKSRYDQSIIHLLFLHLLLLTLVPVVQAAPSTIRDILHTILSPRQAETPLEAPTDLRWECQWKNHSALACDGLGTWYGTESVWRQCDVIIEPYVTKVCAGYTKCFSPEPDLQLCARWPEDYCPYPDEIVIELEPERVRRMTSSRSGLLDGHGTGIMREESREDRMGGFEDPGNGSGDSTYDDSIGSVLQETARDIIVSFGASRVAGSRNYLRGLLTSAISATDVCKVYTRGKRP